MSLFYRFQAILYKILLCLFVVGVVVYLLPRAGSFQYEIQAGKPWQYETLLAPYDFPIQKTQVELEEERTRLKANIPRYFRLIKKYYQPSWMLLINMLQHFLQAKRLTHFLLIGGLLSKLCMILALYPFLRPYLKRRWHW